MYKALIVLLFISTSFSSLAQYGDEDKVNWSYVHNPLNNSIELKAEIAEGWHLYSQYTDESVGPVATSFEFKENSSVKFQGKVIEPESVKVFDPNFEGEVMYFSHEVTFLQKVKIEQPTEIVGMITYMVCDDSMCLPPTDEIFKITIK